MKHKKWIIIVLLLAAVSVYVLTTGGVIFTTVDGFGGQRDICLVSGLQSDVWLSPTTSSFAIPFVFYYEGGGSPFDMRLQIWDKRKEYRAIEITEVVIKYEDGEVVRKTVEWARGFTPYTQYNSSSSGVVQTNMFAVTDRIQALVGRHVNAVITLKGRLLKRNGEAVLFEASEYFTAQSKFHILTFWQAIASA